MASDIFRNIIEQKIDIFANSFEDGASNIFTKDDKIFHPLEYGMYKERCAKELLSFIANKKISISDGFLITAHNNISTQCDIIMYENDTLPLIDNGIANFYPIEIVKGIGEIKSTLDKSSFANALVKLAKNKMLFSERKGYITSKERENEEDNEIFSFLICNKLSFDVSQIDFDEIYKDIPDLKYRHNAILSLQDGLITYRLDFSKLPPKQTEFMKLKGVNINCAPVLWNFSHHTAQGERYKCEVKFQQIDMKNKYNHITTFLIIIKALLRDVYSYEFDLVEYLIAKLPPVFEK